MSPNPLITGVTNNMGLTLPTIGEAIGSWEPKILQNLNIIDGQLGPFTSDFKHLPFEPVTGIGGDGPLFEPNGIANIVSVLKFYLNRYLRVAKILIRVSTVAEIGKFAYVGIYKLDGTRICYSKFDVSVVNTTLIVATDVSVVLAPGIYYYAIGSDSLIAKGQTVQGFWSTALTNIIIGGQAANLISGGAMPAILGAITPGLGGTLPSAVLLSH